MTLDIQNKEFDYKDSLEGRFLVASSMLDNSCFSKTIIYVCAHDDEGAIGVIINNKIGVVDFSKSIKGHKKLPTHLIKKQYPIMFGGPVNSEQVVVLSTNKAQRKNFSKEQRLTFHANTEVFFNHYINIGSKDKFLIIKGITAWDANQLEAEIEENSWLVTTASYDIIFSQKIKKKWEYIISKMGVKNFNNLVNYSGHA